MNGSESILAVYLGKKIIANLFLRQEDLMWQYTPDWQIEGFPVSPHLPLLGDIPSININRFLRNLLPEGHAFEELIQSIHVGRNNTFALIHALGLDTPGALILKQAEASLPTQSAFRLLTEDELSARLDKRSETGLIIWDGKPRLSVAGVQDKINVVINLQGELGFGEGDLCSTHILKFERKRQPYLVLNEYVTMQLAKACGIKTANVSLKHYGNHRALLVERFDRKLISDTTVKRRHIIDGCQALNLPPEYKYEKNFGSGRDIAHIRDGVSLPLLFDFANRCRNAVLTKQQILDWVLFNILIYNFDAHGKNISFYMDSQGVSLAPFYDLVNIKLYPDVEQEFAMALGDEFDSDMINAYQLADFAESCQLSRGYVAKKLKEMINKMFIALPQEIKKINEECGDTSYLSFYQRIVTLRCKHLIAQYQDISRIRL